MWEGLKRSSRSKSEFYESIGNSLHEKGIRVNYGTEPSSNPYIQFEGTYDTPETRQLMSISDQEISKYTSNFLHNINLSEVSFVRNLRVHNTGTSNFIPLYATIDPIKGSMILDTEIAARDELYQRSRFHHELFHLADYTINNSFTYNDPEWIALNPREFRYQGNGAMAHAKGVVNHEHPIPGFVTEYSTFAIEEDRAETFMYLMTDHLRERLQTWARSDQVLKNKANLLQGFIADIN